MKEAYHHMDIIRYDTNYQAHNNSLVCLYSAICVPFKSENRILYFDIISIFGLYMEAYNCRDVR